MTDVSVLRLNPQLDVSPVDILTYLNSGILEPSNWSSKATADRYNHRRTTLEQQEGMGWEVLPPFIKLKQV